MNRMMQKPHALFQSDYPRLGFSMPASLVSQIYLRNSCQRTVKFVPFYGGKRRRTLSFKFSELKPHNPWRISVCKGELVEVGERTSPNEVKPSLTFSQSFNVLVLVIDSGTIC